MLINNTLSRPKGLDILVCLVSKSGTCYLSLNIRKCNMIQKALKYLDTWTILNWNERRLHILKTFATNTTRLVPCVVYSYKTVWKYTTALVDRLGKTTHTRERPGFDSHCSHKLFPYVRWMSLFMHPWHVWPLIDCQSMMVGRKTSIQNKTTHCTINTFKHA